MTAWHVAAVATWRETQLEASGWRGRDDLGRVDDSQVLLPAKGGDSPLDPWGSRWTPASGYWTAPQVTALLTDTPQRAAALLPHLAHYQSDLRERKVLAQLQRLLSIMAHRGLCAGTKRKGWSRVKP